MEQWYEYNEDVEAALVSLSQLRSFLREVAEPLDTLYRVASKEQYSRILDETMAISGGIAQIGRLVNIIDRKVSPEDFYDDDEDEE